MVDFAPAQQQDIPLLCQLSRELILTYEDPTQVDIPECLAWMERKFTKRLSEYHRILWEGQLAGFIRACAGPEKLELDDLYILPGFRGQGIGTQALGRCLRESRRPVFFYVFCRNQGAIRLYQRLGCVITRQPDSTHYIMEYPPPESF